MLSHGALEVLQTRGIRPAGRVSMRLHTCVRFTHALVDRTGLSSSGEDGSPSAAGSMRSDGSLCGVKAVGAEAVPLTTCSSWLAMVVARWVLLDAAGNGVIFSRSGGEAGVSLQGSATMLRVQRAQLGLFV